MGRSWMKMNLQEQYKRLFKARVATTDKKLFVEAKTLDDTQMMKIAMLDQNEFLEFLENVRHPDNSPDWTAFTLAWINTRLGKANADLVALDAKIDADGNIKWTVERGSFERYR